MELLPIEFVGSGEVAGVKFRQLYRYKDLCIYERDGGRAYEVIRVRPQKEKKLIVKGVPVTFKAKERYPKGNEWGKFEYYLPNLETVIERFNQQAAALDYKITITESDLLTTKT